MPSVYDTVTGRYMTPDAYPIIRSVARGMARYAGSPRYRRIANTAGGALVTAGAYGGYRAYKGYTNNNSGYSKPGTVTNYKPSTIKKTYRSSKKTLPKKKGLKRDVAKIKNAITALRQSENASLGKLTYRARGVERLLAGVNVQNFITVGLIGNTELETAGGQLQYYDSSTGALVTQSIAVGTYSKKMLVKSVTSSILLRNNYQADVNVLVYLCKIRDDTDQTPSVAFANVTDNAISGSSSTIGMFPSDSELMGQLWHTKRLSNEVLSPGQQLELSHTENNFEYDPSTVDSHNLEYQREYKSFGYLVIINGCLSHDVTLNQQGRSQAGIDIEESRTIKISYDAGANISRVYVVNAYDTATTAFTQSQKPIPDNVVYAVN